MALSSTRTPVRPRYDRLRDLPRLLPITANELMTDDVAGDREIVSLILRALRKERQRGLARHWTYDVARHRQLMAAYHCEIQQLRSKLVRETQLQR